MLWRLRKWFSSENGFVRLVYVYVLLIFKKLSSCYFIIILLVRLLSSVALENDQKCNLQRFLIIIIISRFEALHYRFSCNLQSLSRICFPVKLIVILGNASIVIMGPVFQVSFLFLKLI